MKSRAVQKRVRRKKTLRERIDEFMQPGFTIVELLIVIVVIGILVGITTTAYGGIQQRSRNAARLQAAENVKKIVESSYVTNGGLPFAQYGARNCASDNLPDIDNDGTKDCGEVANPQKPATYNQALIDRFKLIARTLPQGPPIETWSPNIFYGPILAYYPGWKIDSKYKPVILEYWLEGGQQACTVGSPILFLDESATSPVGPSGAADRPLGYSPNRWSYTDDQVTYCYTLLEADRL